MSAHPDDFAGVREDIDRMNTRISKMRTQIERLEGEVKSVSKRRDALRAILNQYEKPGAKPARPGVTILKGAEIIPEIVDILNESDGSMRPVEILEKLRKRGFGVSGKNVVKTFSATLSNEIKRAFPRIRRIGEGMYVATEMGKLNKIAPSVATTTEGAIVS